MSFVYLNRLLVHWAIGGKDAVSDFLISGMFMYNTERKLSNDVHEDQNLRATKSEQFKILKKVLNRKAMIPGPIVIFQICPQLHSDNAHVFGVSDYCVALRVSSQWKATWNYFILSTWVNNTIPNSYFFFLSLWKILFLFYFFNMVAKRGCLRTPFENEWW